jgi:hypothetical protein
MHRIVWWRSIPWRARHINRPVRAIGRVVTW